MIPYDDLVVALQAWRAKKGLPVGQMSGSIVPPPPPAAAPRAASATPGSGRSGNKPPTPPRAQSQHPATVTTQSVEPATDTYDGLAGDRDVEHEVGDHELNEGDDFAMAFSNLEASDDSESTAVGSVPAPASAPRSGNTRRNDDW
jgi:hypothetical protein